jgi:hypothetical protein
MAGCKLWLGVLMSDWQAELDALIKQTTTFANSINSEIRTPRASAHQAVKLIGLAPLANRNDSEREEMRKRVASFKAHQQRLIRDREEYAASVLRRLRSPLV